MTRLISIDPSTKASGVATFDDAKLVDYQLFKQNICTGDNAKVYKIFGITKEFNNF